jgi:CheY-like chemotaxis protein
MRALHALVIDDSGLARKTITQALAQTGLADFTFTEFGDGAEALDAARDKGVDLIFVDLHMPRMGGVEFLRQLRKRNHQIPPIVMITSETHGDMLLSVVNDAGVDALLLKPLDAARLKQGLLPIIQAIPMKDGAWRVPQGECVVEAVQQSFSRACRMELTPAAAAESPDSGLVIYGLFTLSGDVHWSLNLALDGPVAEEAATQFGGYAMTLDHPEIGDAIAEITNIIAGWLKRLLSERGLAVQQSLPSVLIARDLRFLVERGKRTASDQAYFLTDRGRIGISVSAGLNPGLTL